MLEREESSVYSYQPHKNRAQLYAIDNPIPNGLGHNTNPFGPRKPTSPSHKTKP